MNSARGIAASALLLVAATVRPAEAQQRVVTLGASATETVVALGLGSRIVGADRSSAIFAPSASTQLDFFRNVSAEGVIALRPTLVIAIDGSGPPAALEQIRSAGITVRELDRVLDPTSAGRRIRVIGEALGASRESAALAERVEREAREASQLAASSVSAPKVLAIYARGAGTLFVSGTGTPMAAMLGLANARNAVTAFTEYRPLTPESVIAAAPDYILVPERGLASIGGIDGILALPGIAQTPAGKRRAIVTVDDHLLLGFGPQLAEGIRRLAAALHPELAGRLAQMGK